MLLVTLRPGADVMQRAQYALEHDVGAFRVNFSRCSVEDNVALIRSLRGLSSRLGVPVEVFVDLPGPKARAALFARGSEILSQGHAFALLGDPGRPGDAFGMGVSDPAILCPLRRGDIVKVADGGVHLRVVTKTGASVSCVVVKAGRVYSRCGIVAPGRYTPNGALTGKDRRILAILDTSVTAVCVSFADTPAIVAETRAHLGGRASVVAKIESPAAVACLDDLAQVSDGVMHARGDLRAFFTPREMRRIATDLRRSAVSHATFLILATNYFTGICDRGALSTAEAQEIRHALSLQPDYLLVNETSHTAPWRHVIDAASALTNAHGKPVRA